MNDMTERQKVNSLHEFPHGTNMSGLVIGPENLVIIAEADKRNISGIDRRFFLVQCGHCENQFEAQASNLQLGLTKSCGCLRGRPLPAEQRPHSDQNYLRMLHLGLTYQNEQLPDCDEWVNLVQSDIGNRDHSDQRLVRLNESDGFHAGNLAWSE